MTDLVPPVATNWLKQTLTGADNRTVAWGRFAGLVLLVLTVLAPIAELLTVAFKKLAVEQWGAMLAQWQVFVPILAGTAGGVIAGTAFTEPKPRSE